MMSITPRPCYIDTLDIEVASANSKSQLKAGGLSLTDMTRFGADGWVVEGAEVQNHRDKQMQTQ